MTRLIRSLQANALNLLLLLLLVSLPPSLSRRHRRCCCYCSTLLTDVKLKTAHKNTKTLRAFRRQTRRKRFNRLWNSLTLESIHRMKINRYLTPINVRRIICLLKKHQIVDSIKYADTRSRHPAHSQWRRGDKKGGTKNRNIAVK